MRFESRIGHHRVEACDPLHRCQQAGQAAFCDAGDDFGAEICRYRRFMDDNETTGASDRFDDGGGIERLQRSDIDDFGLDAFRSHFFCRCERLADHRAP